MIAFRDPQGVGVLGVDLHERTGVEPVELGDLAGLGHRVPLVLQAAGVEDERIVVVGEFRSREVRAGEELRTPARGREGQPRARTVLALQQGLADTVVEIADRVAVRSVDGRCRPLDRCGAQPLVGHATQVPSRPGIPRPLELLEHLLGTVVRERVGEAHRAGDPGDQLPVGQCLLRGVDDALHEREVPLGVDHDAVGLRPQRRGQHDVGVGVGLGLGEHVLCDDEFGGLQAGDDGPAVGDRGDGVGADDPARLDVAGGHPLEHLDRAASDLGTQGTLGDPPQVLDEGALGLDQDGALTGQAGAHVSHVPPAHGVGLAGEGEGPGARAAESAGGEVQVDQGVGVPGAVRGLIQAHGPAAHPLTCLTDPLCGLPDVALGDAGDLRDLRGRVVPEEIGHLLPALGELGDERLVGVAVRDQEVQQAVEQGEVGAGLDLEEEVGLVGGGVAARVDDDQPGSGRLDPVHHAQEEDRVAVGHVGADHEERVRVIEVLVRAGRAVSAQRQLVAGSRRSHAQPRVRLDLVRPDEALRQLVRQILRLQGHLPGHVEGQGVRPVLVQNRPQPAGHRRDRLVHVRLGGLGAPFRAHQCPGGAPGRGHHVRARRALGAQAARVGGMVLVPGHLRRPASPVGGVPGDVEHDSAADPAVRTDRTDPVLLRASWHRTPTFRPAAA